MKRVKIKGMSCSHCVAAVKKALSDIEGVENVDVDLDKAEASFEDGGTVDLAVVEERIRKAGYEIG